MRKYGIKYYLDFANTYSLGYTDEELPEGWERITRKEAECMARAESKRAKEDPYFSGYADTYVYPIGLTEEQALDAYEAAQYGGSKVWRRSGRVIEKRK